jgi:hypothetical protein
MQFGARWARRACVKPSKDSLPVLRAQRAARRDLVCKWLAFATRCAPWMLCGALGGLRSGGVFGSRVVDTQSPGSACSGCLCLTPLQGAPEKICRRRDWFRFLADLRRLTGAGSALVKNRYRQVLVTVGFSCVSTACLEPLGSSGVLAGGHVLTRAPLLEWRAFSLHVVALQPQGLRHLPALAGRSC